ncbi:MAG: hypothetical protein HQ551_01115 [Desulfobacteraceae bacterium]|nr:hypothetical protein [Desulfobacteraceae bacterium]
MTIHLLYLYLISSSQAEELVEEQAQILEDHKDYLIQVWDRKSAQSDWA